MDDGTIASKLADLRAEKARLKAEYDDAVMNRRPAGSLPTALYNINQQLNRYLRLEHNQKVVGRRIRMVEMIDDPDPILPGTEGTVTGADDAGHLFVDWDNGRTLHVIPGIDIYNII